MNADPKHWAATWAAANKTQVARFDDGSPAVVANNTTLRQTVRISRDSNEFHVWLTNERGTEALPITQATLALFLTLPNSFLSEMSMITKKFAP